MMAQYFRPQLRQIMPVNMKHSGGGAFCFCFRCGGSQHDPRGGKTYLANDLFCYTTYGGGSMQSKRRCMRDEQQLISSRRYPCSAFTITFLDLSPWNWACNRLGEELNHKWRHSLKACPCGGRWRYRFIYERYKITACRRRAVLY